MQKTIYFYFRYCKDIPKNIQMVPTSFMAAQGFFMGTTLT